MVINNKVLIVLYGIFFCMLEGFEDNFDIMKVIVEYFRDLVVDDCYFGVEFLIFDVEMLVWIVECEIECCV